MGVVAVSSATTVTPWLKVATKASILVTQLSLLYNIAPACWSAWPGGKPCHSNVIWQKTPYFGGRLAPVWTVTTHCATYPVILTLCTYICWVIGTYHSCLLINVVLLLSCYHLALNFFQLYAWCNATASGLHCSCCRHFKRLSFFAVHSLYMLRLELS